MPKNNNDCSQVAVPWERLEQWIKEQKESGDTLPQPQLEAISKLIPLMGKEPDVSGGNYVSQLHEFATKNGLGSPAFHHQDPIRVPILGVVQTLHRCKVKFPTVEGDFPRDGFGYTDGEEIPAFVIKQNAKQYAAQQALIYLDADEHSFEDISDTELPSSGASSVAGESDNEDDGLKGRGSASSKMSSKTPASTQAATDFEAADDLPISIFERVFYLAGCLKFSQPRYEITPDDVGIGFFSGMLYIESGGNKPLKLGYVQRVRGKDNARLQIATKALDHLEMTFDMQCT